MQTYETHYEITPELADEKGNARLSALLYFAQEAAGEHCELLGLDWDTMAAKELFWAVIRAKVRIHTLPRLGQQVTVKTWPMPTTRVAYPRSTAAYDSRGNELFRAVSLWVLMNTETRALMLPGKSGVEVPGILRGSELSIPGSLAPKGLEREAVCTVGFNLLDRNGHMNNTRYLDWVTDLLPAAFHREHPLREFTVCYLSEALEQQQIDIHWDIDEAGLLQVDAHRRQTAVDAAQPRVFTAQLQF